MNPYSVKISPDTRSQLKRIAQAQNTSCHAIASLAIETYVANQNPSVA
jgi:predicted transcriptional regulator